MIRKWILDLADAWNHRMTNQRQLDIYEDEIRKLELTDHEIESLRLQLIREMDKFPSISQLVQIGSASRRTKGEAPDWDRWKRESCSTEEGTRIFREAFVKGGGDLSKLPLSKSMAMDREPGEEG